MAPLEQTARPFNPSCSAIGSTVRGGRPLASTTLKPAATAARTASLVRGDSVPSWRSRVPSRSLAINSIIFVFFVIRLRTPSSRRLVPDDDPEVASLRILSNAALRMEVGHERVERPGRDRTTQALHQFLIV